MATRSVGMVAATAAALVVGGWLRLSAQERRPGQLPEFRSGIELVTVDVGVVDKNGNPLRGLEPGDFVVTVGGQPRRVVTAEFVDATPAQPGAITRPDAVVPVSTNEGGGVGRLFVFVVDQNTLDPGNARRAANAASRFLSRLTFADRSSLMLIPVGQNIGFTWAHDRVREALQRVSGVGRPMLAWEMGSLTEARDITNHNMLALRTVGDRECRSSVFASDAFGGAASPGSGSTGGTPAPTPPPSGGGTPSGEGGGSGAAPAGAGQSSGSGGSRSRGSSGFSLNTCTRDIQMQAEATWRSAQMTSLSSLAGLRQVLASLANVRGDKTVIIISGGWPLDEREETSLLSSVASEAAAARATLFTLFMPTSLFSAERRMMTPTPISDQYLHSWPLETLAAMTGGRSFRADVGAEGIFDRLGRELAGYYRLGVEREPTDVNGKSRRMKVQVSRSGATVRAREVFDVRTYEDRDWSARLASALEGPVPATGVGLRVTSYLAADPDDASRLKLVVAGEASRLQPGEASFELLVSDLQGKKILSGEQPLGDVTKDAVPFSTSIPLAPGSYIVRMAVMDGAGKVGSVDHRVDVRQVPLGPLSVTGPLLVRVPAGAAAEPRVALDGARQDERLALEVDLEGKKEQLADTEVVFEIAASERGPALVQSAAALSPGSRDGSLLAQAIADMRLLPPGQYVVRATVKSGSDSLGEVHRLFSVLEAPRALANAASRATAESTSSPAPLPVRRPVAGVPRFAVEQVLAPSVLTGFLDRVAARPDAAAPAMRELLDRARTTQLGELAISDDLAAQAPVAAFLQGLTLLAQNKLDPAADAFRTAMRGSADFYPAMVYLGACYAAGGKDKEAAGAWRTAMIKEGDAVALHVLLTDAFLRQGRGDLALGALDAARARWPEEDALNRRFVTAALLAGKYVEGLEAVDELIERRAADEPSLVGALLVLYEAFANGRPIEGVEQDRARMTRFAETYRAQGGPSVALVDTWLAAANSKH